MTKEKNNETKEQFRTICDIFGYALIGIFAFTYGLILQYYNQVKLIEPIEPIETKSQIILISIIQVILIILYGYSYATVFLKKESSYKKNHELKRIYGISGKWIEIILVSVVVAIIIHCIINNMLYEMLNFWIVLLTILILFGLSSFYYRVHFYEENDNNKQELQKIKNVLVYPAALMIGVNIYIGSSIYGMLSGNIVYYIPILIYMAFFCVISMSSILNNKKKKNTDVIISCFFSVLIIVSGLLSYKNNISIPFKNMFLSVTTAIFLSVFESWYISFRQMKDAENKSYAKATSYILTFMPAVVLMLYPIQNFNIIYLISCCFGMIISDIGWFYWILPKIDNCNEDESKKTRKAVALIRALLGILTFMFLSMDKFWQYTPSIPRPKRTVENFFAIISILLPAINTVKNIFNKKKNNVFNKHLILRFVAFSVTFLVFELEQTYAYSFNDKKYTLSYTALIAYIFIDFILYIYINCSNISTTNDKNISI